MEQKPIHVIVENNKSEKPWYLPTDNLAYGDYLLTLTIIAGAITWAISTYKDRKQDKKVLEQEKKEFRWRQVKFLFEQAQLFDTDPSISEAIKIITGNNTDIDVSDLFDFDSEMTSVDRGSARHNLDKLLNLLDRISYAYKNETLSIEDLNNFSWYFNKVYKQEDLKLYCDKYFPDILDVAKELGCDNPKLEL